MGKIVIKATGETSENELMSFIAEAYKELNVDSNTLLKITIEKVSDEEYNKD